MRRYRTVTDYTFGQPDHAPPVSELETKAEVVMVGVKYAHERVSALKWPEGSRIEPHHHGIRQLESGGWRCVTDWTVHGSLSEQVLEKMAVDKALLLRWSIARDFSRAQPQMNHYGLRRLQEAQPTPEPSPTSSP